MRDNLGFDQPKPPILAARIAPRVVAVTQRDAAPGRHSTWYGTLVTTVFGR
jgi:hypothetical protein